MLAKAQHEPQEAWFFTGVVMEGERVRQSKAAGLLARSSTSARPDALRLPRMGLRLVFCEANSVSVQSAYSLMAAHHVDSPAAYLTFCASTFFLFSSNSASRLRPPRRAEGSRPYWR